MDKLKGILFVTIIAALFIACSITPKVFDDSLPEDEQATIYFSGVIPTSFNGIGLEKNTNYLKIPGGSTEFVCNISWRSGNTIYSGEDAIFRYTFEKNMEYCAYFNIKDSLWGVDVYNAPLQKIGWPPKNTLIGFVPFVNQKKN